MASRPRETGDAALGTGGRPAPREVLRRGPFGRMAFADTDLAGAMDQRNCFLEAQRAVQQILGRVLRTSGGAASPTRWTS